MRQEQIDADRFDLQRFVRAQEDSFSEALAELKNGRKRSHWMWFIFPQIDGLGHSSMTKRYSIKSLDEAGAYLQHPILGKRLKECAEAVLAIEGKTVSEIFGFPDDLKLKSSMTLFDAASGDDDLFSRILDKYFQGQKDLRTLALLAG